jgi:alkylhydroperoxidase/carboxymuconolactone decarboxylase family protein YurZ
MTSGNNAEFVKREADLITMIDKTLPDFAAACRAQDIPVVLLHQDAFAADYQEEEYRLLGMAIKFAGTCGKEINIHGKNRETVGRGNTVN